MRLFATGSASNITLSGRHFGPSVVSANSVASQNLIFFDDFNYTVTPSADDASSNESALLAAGWSNAKALNLPTNNGAGGYLYTVDYTNIPGHTGTAPGTGPKALCLNSLSLTLGGIQTDFYVQIGGGSGFIPADAWIQFWLYPCYSGSELTGFCVRDKFLYATGPSGYPTGDNNWLWQIGRENAHDRNNGYGAQTPHQASAFCRQQDAVVDHPYYTGDQAIPNGTTSHLGQTNTSEYIAVNRWTLCKVHYDTRNTNGIYEVWMKAPGNSFTKVAEWIGGTSPDFTWTIDASRQGRGHNAIRIPTTMGRPLPDTYDAWIYMRDFAIAANEADLPVYG